MAERKKEVPVKYGNRSQTVIPRYTESEGRERNKANVGDVHTEGMELASMKSAKYSGTKSAKYSGLPL